MVDPAGEGSTNTVPVIHDAVFATYTSHTNEWPVFCIHKRLGIKNTNSHNPLRVV